MKKFTFLLLLLPALSFAQLKKYGLATAGIHLISTDSKPGAELTLGVLPKSTMGFGLSLDWIHDYGTPLLADLRYISKGNNGARLTVGPKLGYYFDNLTNIKGGFTVGGQAGLIIGRKTQSIIVTIQYLSLGYDKINPVNGNSIGKSSFNDFSINAGFKFW